MKRSRSKIKQAKARMESYELGLQEGIRRGKAQAIEEMKADQKARVTEARIKLLNAFGQSIQSMANILDNDRSNV